MHPGFVGIRQWPWIKTLLHGWLPGIFVYSPMYPAALWQCCLRQEPPMKRARTQCQLVFDFKRHCSWGIRWMLTDGALEHHITDEKQLKNLKGFGCFSRCHLGNFGASRIWYTFDMSLPSGVIKHGNGKYTMYSWFSYWNPNVVRGFPSLPRLMTPKGKTRQRHISHWATRCARPKWQCLRSGCL